MRASAACLALLASLLCLGAAPPDRVIAHPGGGPALIVPAASPVHFTGFDKNGVARFKGRFLLSGQFTYGCRIDCEEVPLTRDYLELNLVPDPDVAGRLPHWKGEGEGMVIGIDRISRLEPAIASRQELAGLLSGKTPEITGHISLFVDNFIADFGCDYSPYYSARFVSLPRPAKLARLEVKGDFGCA